LSVFIALLACQQAPLLILTNKYAGGGRIDASNTNNAGI